MRSYKRSSGMLATAKILDHHCYQQQQQQQQHRVVTQCQTQLHCDGFISSANLIDIFYKQATVMHSGTLVLLQDRCGRLVYTVTQTILG